MKNFFASKLNGVGLVVALVGLQDFITTFDFSAMTIQGWVTFGLGLLVIFLRTYFTSTAIK